MTTEDDNSASSISSTQPEQSAAIVDAVERDVPDVKPDEDVGKSAEATETTTNDTKATETTETATATTTTAVTQADINNNSNNSDDALIQASETTVNSTNESDEQPLKATVSTLQPTETSLDESHLTEKQMEAVSSWSDDSDIDSISGNPGRKSVFGSSRLSRQQTDSGQNDDFDESKYPPIIIMDFAYHSSDPRFKGDYSIVQKQHEEAMAAAAAASSGYGGRGGYGFDAYGDDDIWGADRYVGNDPASASSSSGATYDGTAGDDLSSTTSVSVTSTASGDGFSTGSGGTDSPAASAYPDFSVRGYVQAMYDFTGSTDNELSFEQGTLIFVQYKACPGWLVGTIPPNTDSVGLLPENYVVFTS